MNAKKVLIDGISLNEIIRYYKLIPVLINEIRKSNGSFEKYDSMRGKEEDAESIDVGIVFI